MPLPQSGRVEKALQKLDLLVVQDIIHSDTAKIADAVLPGAALSEKQGSVTNLEGRIQSFDPVVQPPGKAKADWKILDLLAARLGDSKPYESIANIRKEIRQLPYTDIPGWPVGLRLKLPDKMKLILLRPWN